MLSVHWLHGLVHGHPAHQARHPILSDECRLPPGLEVPTYSFPDPQPTGQSRKREFRVREPSRAWSCKHRARVPATNSRNESIILPRQIGVPFMSGYSAAPQHNHLSAPQSTLAPTPNQHDTVGPASLSAIAGSYQPDSSVLGYLHLNGDEGAQQQGPQQQSVPINHHNLPQTAVQITASAIPSYNFPASAGPEANSVSMQQPQAAYSSMTQQSSAPPAPPVQPTLPAPPGNLGVPGSTTNPGSDPGGLAPPPELVYRTFDELLAAVQRFTDQQGYGVVKLRASNYREGKPTRYDLVDCPWRAKAVCEVQLNHQWRFSVQESRHNHEARVPAAPPGQENTPVAQSLRSMLNKIDRLSHDMMDNFNQLRGALSNVEKRLEALERERPPMLSGNGVPQMGAPSMPPANMGGSGIGNGALTNGGMQSLVDSRMGGVESGLSQMGSRGLEGLPMMVNDQ
ncbi:uncharacterized protein B0T15DRAFT_318227 [Chaetomium strumarium]|uniref:FAR1 domain-containing protein n=1 Tax=Chaetomium strumarium TaxID=1170767 RepID=A0AAJ0GKK6_9PEZI|nr:hypothetical protein B0T15DRAFT_318227 [Chaetomium strumarium]